MYTSKRPRQFLQVEIRAARADELKTILSSVPYLAFSLENVTSYEDVWDKIRCGGYDLVFFDDRVSDPKELERLRRYRLEGGGSQVVLLTDFSDLDFLRSMFSFGVSDYLRYETLTPEVLERTVRHCTQVMDSSIKSFEYSKKIDNLLSFQSKLNSSELGFPEFYDFIADNIRDLCDCQSVLVEILKEDRFVCAGGSGNGTRFSGFEFQYKNDLSSGVIESRSTIRIEDFETDPRLNRDQTKLATGRSGVALPLYFLDRPLGVLKIFSSEAYTFSKDDVKILELASSITGGILYERGLLAELKEKNLSITETQTIAKIGNWSLNLETGNFVCAENTRRIFGLEQSYEFDPEKREDPFVFVLDRDRVEKLRKYYIKNSECYEIEYRIVNKEGGTFRVAERARVYRNREGKAVRLEGTFQDLTGLRNSEESLKFLKTGVEMSEDAYIVSESVWTQGIGRKIIYVNEAFVKLTGYKRDEVLGKSATLLQGPKSDPRIVERIQASLGLMTSLKEEIVIYDKAGRDLLVDIGIYPIRDEFGSVTHFISIIRDISEKRVHENKLRQSQKMEAVGQLAGGIAHDFNNLLNVILGNLEILQVNLKTQPELLRWVRSALDAIQKGVDLNRRLLSFAREQPVNPETLDVNYLIREFVPILSKARTENHRIEYDLSPIPMLCSLERGGLENALLNLVINSKDAMPEGGVVRIRTEFLKVGPSSNFFFADLEEGSYCLLTVTDGGSGMSEETRHRLFEPFYTTKGGKGTGLGLPMVYSFVKRSKGKIEILFEPEGGTTFAILIPVILGGDDPTVFGCARSEKVILVSDDAVYSEIASAFLKRMGCKFWTTGDAARIFPLIEENSPITCVMLDASVPNADLAIERLSENPSVRLIRFGKENCGKSISIPRPYCISEFSKLFQNGLRSHVTV
ncbi:PAS domain-containing protein [Leptospira gomenensis]|uniref:histidine kinase n=1 Tax=Leptospira gomenensis TaxID=2484974 RepID=A0A5F1YCR1_9LEPT|nr:PAS domain-containing protein [Leptospira gomenensis]TGK33208.1 PAS domain-containing protein [Leptospira gomenensis]TGK35559.1 PAS domain-containing protein [Leptospira gomenensis]TGK40883.1 PAS domain-containing protein [Leptospira gomenensis]TGK61173.1 PAS domain-containing protein [Leptospira gomenensis]